MADAFLGEIRIFAGNFPPKGWQFCEGQLVRVSEFTALFSILGVSYGGDGKTTFALPDLRGRAPMSQGQGPGLTPRSVGERGGAETVTLLTNQMPAHNHGAMGVSATGSTKSPDSAVWSQFASEGRQPVPANLFAATGDVQMAPTALSPAGQSQPHNNMQPYLALRYIICFDGEYPSRP